ncbi:CGNR zinc finger domain-containing protein [Paenibacillus humicola]|uniref:CGNR zinc finger domain-containing protein n=1 Tax=Paenibacillus humicola TaxID=3110540 RepID=UPI00237BFBC0|nr:CGNR zinc finger domain-containing protein [Paenibacillus humicola]
MPKKNPPGFCFVGDHPVLDFINTKLSSYDLLKDYPSLLNWLHEAHLLSREEALAYEQRWPQAQTDEAASTAIELRSNLMQLIEKCRNNRPIADTDLNPVNHLLQDRAVADKLALMDNRFIVERRLVIRKPVDLLVPIAEAAADLLSANKLHLVKRCENPKCMHYFYDTSKNGLRRWCSQKTCGNRMRVNAYLQRHRDKQEAADKD